MEKTISIPQCNPKASYLKYKRDIDSAITRVLDNGNYILGPEVEAFEAEFASFTGAQYAAGVANGTDAIEEKAREELGMVKKGEIYFQVINKSEP